MPSQEELKAIFELLHDIFTKKSGITNADTLWERARRTRKGRELGVTKKHAETYLKGEGRSEVYKEVAQQWPGKYLAP